VFWLLRFIAVLQTVVFDPRQRQSVFFSSLCVQTGSGAHPASYTMGTAGSFPGGKARPGHDDDRSPPSSAEVEKSRSYTSSAASATTSCSGTTLRHTVTSQLFLITTFPPLSPPHCRPTVETSTCSSRAV
jgi:hypothetical protein